MAIRIAHYPWEEHALGPIDRWPQSLRTAVSLILDSRHPMWIGWGESMTFLYNDAYLHVLGIAKHPWALGRPAWEVWAEIWDICGPLAEKVFRNGEATFVDDVRLFMSRGDRLEETFYSFSYSPIRDESGRVAGLFCPSNDVTAKVVGARRLRTLSELAGKALTEITNEAACASAARTLEKNPDDLPFGLIYLADGERLRLQQRIGIDGAAAVDEVLDPAQLGCRLLLDAARWAPRGAAGLPVTEALVLPIAGQVEARPLGALVAGINPTAPLDTEYATFFELIASSLGTAMSNARAVTEAQRRADMLAEMDRAKTDFFSNVSHEFRTPLTLMLAPLGELALVNDERERHLAQSARRNALRLLKLVNALLEFSRLEAGRTDATFVETDLAALTRDIASGFRSAIESAGLRFTVSTPLEERAYVDPSMWERVLLNLLSNALKFTLDGAISIELQREGDDAVLRVSDTGTGIAPEEIARLFERFHRIRGAQSRSYEGSGIGLALVQDLVRLHGGSVDVESALNRGTTFSVRIPLGRAHLDSARIAPAGSVTFTSAAEQYLADVESTMTVRVITPASSAGEPGLARPRVLLADDNHDLRAYLTDILGTRYDVTATSNGAEALEAARNGHYDLIVSDVMMPVMDGFELLRAIRAAEDLSTIPFILLSARAGEEAAIEGLGKGADDYIVKPFAREELLARVGAQLSAAAIRERATEQLRASESRYRTLAASLPYIVFEADADGRLTYVSDEFTRYTGEPAERAYGNGWRVFVHPDDRGEMPSRAEMRLRRGDGLYRWFSVRAVAQREEGRIVRWTGTATDIHDQRQAIRERDFLARASELLARPLELDETLRAVAAFTVPEFADWCQIDLRTEDGRVRTVAVAHRDRSVDRLAQHLVGSVNTSPDSAYGSPYVMRTGRSQLLTQVRPEMISQTVESSETLALYERLGFGPSIAVPLIAEGQTVGMLAVVYGPSSRTYTEDDLPMFEELGRRAGLAIHRARLFEREHRAAESFQHASLPTTLPHIAGLRLDAFYSPGRGEALVGGDWYDALRLIDGRVVLSIGDVAGSGLGAAVTMGNMRQIIRGIAQVHADPALMLDAADRALRLEHPDTFVTAFVGVFDPIGNTLTYASAGHPPPVLCHADGRTEMLRNEGLPLGLRANVAGSRSISIALSADSALVLYTDGLTEIDRDPQQGEERLRELLSDPSLWRHEDAARTIVERIFERATPRDDVAVLVANVCEIDAQLDAQGGSFERWSFHAADERASVAARNAFAQAVQLHGGDREDAASAQIVFGELVSNTVRYAPGLVEVIADWSGPDPVVHVLDNGPGFHHISILPPDVMSESGRGLFIVSALTHDFRVSKRANGGSHARAVLRLRGRQLVDSDETLGGSLYYALSDESGMVSG
jgi:PAS domain S-box-containing protein